MSKQLYEEALADVKKLKEIAEDDAKRAILEAVTPRIKDLIENQLLGETADEDEVEDEPITDDLLLDDALENSQSDMMHTAGVDPDAASAISMPDQEGKLTLDLSILTGPDDEMELSMDDEDAVDAFIPSRKIQVVKSESTVRQLEEKIRNYTNASSVLRETKSYLVALVSTITEVEDMYLTLKNAKASSTKQILVKRLIECHKTLKKLMQQETNMKNKFSLNEEDISLTLKGLPDDLDPDDVEIELVTGSAGEDDAEGDEGDEEGDEELDLGGDEEESDDEEELELDDEEESDDEDQMESHSINDNAVVEIDESMLRREISRMRTLREENETKPQSWGHGAGDIGDLEDEDLGEPLELELSEAQGKELDEDDGDEGWWKLGIDSGFVTADDAEKMKMKEADEKDETHMNEDDGDEGWWKLGIDSGFVTADDAEKMKMKEADEAVQVQETRRRLTRESNIQAEAKQKATQAKKQGQKKQLEAQQKRKQAKQKQTEAQEKQKKKQMKEAQKAKAEAQKKQHEALVCDKQHNQLKEAYTFYAKRFNASLQRTVKLQSRLTEISARNGTSKNGESKRLAEKSDTLREKLTEMNLFNAKLLFTNKLLQNESLTKRQKAEVIERLDETQNVREAKLVYESLVKALQGGSTGRIVSESTHRGVIGSSSRPVRPAATITTLNEGFEADRWAKLAGITK